MYKKELCVETKRAQTKWNTKRDFFRLLNFIEDQNQNIYVKSKILKCLIQPSGDLVLHQSSEHNPVQDQNSLSFSGSRNGNLHRQFHTGGKTERADHEIKFVFITRLTENAVSAVD